MTAGHGPTGRGTDRPLVGGRGGPTTEALVAPSPFRQRTVVALIVSGVLFFVLGLYFSTRAAREAPDAIQFKGSAVSVSRIGHAAVYELLGRLGYSVAARTRISDAVSASDLLILAEPVAQPDMMVFYRSALTRAEALGWSVLVVLPKWDGLPHPRRAGWIAGLEVTDPAAPAQILAELDRGARVVRVPEAVWTGSPFTLNPALPRPVQLIADAWSLEPVIDSRQGLLLGRVAGAGGIVWVLSDPDLLNNQGLGQGRNADLLLQILERIGPGFRGRIWFDETIHGILERGQHPLAFFVAFPTLVATLMALLATALVVWAAAVRFGSPLPPPPRLEPGRLELVGRTARALVAPRHRPEMLRQYLRRSLAQVAQRMGVEPVADPAAMAAAIDARRHRRSLAPRAGDLVAQAAPLLAADHLPAEPVLALAQDIHRWKESLLHGTG